MDATRAPLVCPKCGADMRTFERSGMTIDQCTGCRGVFLDRGELERLVDAEGNYYAERGYAGDRGVEGDRHPDPRYGRERYDDDDDDRYRSHRPKRRKRTGFLGELFEGGDD